MERAQSEYFRLVLLLSVESNPSQRLVLTNQIQATLREISDLEKEAALREADQRRRDEAERSNRRDNSRN